MIAERQDVMNFAEGEAVASAWLEARLKGRDWRTAGEILAEIGTGNTESARRRLRAAAEASEGRIAGGQRGYKLVGEMTAVEYGHFRNWMLSQAGAMQRRIVAADRVFFGRQAVG